MTLKTKTNLVLSLVIVFMALPVAALADLKVAIDDGTVDSELFVYLDEFAARGQERGSCDWPPAEYTLRQSVAITSQFDFFMNRGVTIISDDTIDPETREQIRSLLSAAGHDDEVVFVDASLEDKNLKRVTTTADAPVIQTVSNGSTNRIR